MLWTAFLLGLAGSLHCGVMCGPLVLALPYTGRGPAGFVAGRMLYNLGRLTTYGVIGVIFGLLGRSLALAGIQRWVSVLAGVVIIAGLALPAVGGPRALTTRLVLGLKNGFRRLLGRRTASSLFLLGLLNGLLPCGLVYAAAAGAVAMGGLLTGVAYMLLFGLGTVPLMLGLGLGGHALPAGFRGSVRHLIPGSLALVALLLILRGMSLGIPYVSPSLDSTVAGAHCH